MKKTFSLFFLISSLLVLSGCGKTPSPTFKVEENRGISIETVVEHSTTDNCWIVINNNVYNVTDFISSHPGGKAIVDGCGKDATELFETRPSGSGTPHSDRARTMLEKYYIGSLKR